MILFRVRNIPDTKKAAFRAVRGLRPEQRSAYYDNGWHLLTRDRHLSISAGQTGLLGADLWPLTVAQVHASHGEYTVTFQHGYALHVVESGEGDTTYATRTPAELMRWLSTEASWA